MGRHCEAQFHHRNEAVAAGDDASVGIELAKERDRLRKTGWPVILEGSGDQNIFPMQIARACFWWSAARARFARVRQNTVGQLGRTINGR